MTNRSDAFGTLADWIIAGLVAIATVNAGFQGPPWISATALAGVAAAVWFRPSDSLVLWYVAALPFIVPQGVMAIRLSIADLFMLPVIVRSVMAAVRGEWRLPRSTIVGVLAVLALAFAVSTLVGYENVGRLTSYALVNKDAGLLFQIAAYLALLHYAETRVDVLRLARWFVGGVSIANLSALAVALFSTQAGIDNIVYLVGNGRFYGWMEQPTVNGGLMLTAAMIELGLLRTTRNGRAYGAARWINLWLLGLGMALTLSRGSWFAVACGAAVFLFLLLLFDRDPAPLRRRTVAVAAIVWCLVPSYVLGNLLIANLRARLFLSPTERAEEIRCTAIDQCNANPNLPMCAEVRASQAGSAASCGEVAKRTASRAHEVDDDAVYGPMMNARGFNDRFAILRVAWESYVSEPRTIVLGTGLGTFYVTSAREFGVPVIIHSTFEWFLVELGPLGFVTLMFVFGRTTRNLYLACRDGGDMRYVAMGTFAAFAGLAVFCVTSEGFYQRQLWLLILIGDRLCALSSAPSAAPRLQSV
ncbi:MAG TPA: O-antigen ligase family protein [Vicinamibacterales bacterium]|nr:O-antigen ligase family protein [Vicinamibacterales bacterium]